MKFHGMNAWIGYNDVIATIAAYCLAEHKALRQITHSHSFPFSCIPIFFISGLTVPAFLTGLYSRPRKQSAKSMVLFFFFFFRFVHEASTSFLFFFIFSTWRQAIKNRKRLRSATLQTQLSQVCLKITLPPPKHTHTKSYVFACKMPQTDFKFSFSWPRQHKLSGVHRS